VRIIEVAGIAKPFNQGPGFSPRNVPQPLSEEVVKFPKRELIRKPRTTEYLK
jgi:hypothetical protein